MNPGVRTYVYVYSYAQGIWIGLGLIGMMQSVCLSSPVIPVIHAALAKRGNMNI